MFSKVYFDEFVVTLNTDTEEGGDDEITLSSTKSVFKKNKLLTIEDNPE